MTNEEMQKVRELIAAASTGVEHGCVRGKTIDQHAEDFRNSMGYDTAVGVDLHGVYLAGSETVICHTGNGPHSEANARLITFALNNLGKLVDHIERLQSPLTRTALTMENETYLGDAVYASFDGYQIKLRTGDGNNQVIYLEPGVYAALKRFVASIYNTENSHEHSN